MAPWLTTREAVKAALDIRETARANTDIDRAIQSASSNIERHICRRAFRPRTATLYFSWPAPGQGSTWKLYLDDNDLVSITTLTAAGATIPPEGYYLEPNRSGPPYTTVEINRGSQYAFDYDTTDQRAIAVTGVWGFANDESPAGATAEALDATETALDVTNGAAIGVGDLLRIDDERLQVTGRSWLDTSTTLAADLGSTKSNRTVTVSDGTGFNVGEDILIGSETMWVTAITGNDLTVRRSWDGSALAAHTTGAAVYASRTLTVTRGAGGTTAASHLTGAAIHRHVVPTMVEQLAVALAQVELASNRAGQAAEAGEGQTTRDTRGGGLARLRADVVAAYGRKQRFRTV